jgi:hypothetical protein
MRCAKSLSSPAFDHEPLPSKRAATEEEAMPQAEVVRRRCGRGSSSIGIWGRLAPAYRRAQIVPKSQSRPSPSPPIPLPSLSSHSTPSPLGLSPSAPPLPRARPHAHPTDIYPTDTSTDIAPDAAHLSLPWSVPHTHGPNQLSRKGPNQLSRKGPSSQRGPGAPRERGARPQPRAHAGRAPVPARAHVVRARRIVRVSEGLDRLQNQGVLLVLFTSARESPSTKSFSRN